MPPNHGPPDLSIVIPCRNEAELIGPTLEALSQHLASQKLKTEVIVVDDASHDQTLDVVRRFEATLSSGTLRSIETGFHLGKGGAIRIGVENSAGDKVLIIDPDFLTDPSNIGFFVEHLQAGADIVLGTRFTDNLYHRDSHVRILLTFGFQYLFKIMFKLPYDFQCRIKAFRKDVALELLPHVTTDEFGFDADLLVQMSRNLRVQVVPVEWSFRKYGKTVVPRQLFGMLLALVTTWLKHTVREPFRTESVKELAKFWDQLPGDVREKAARSAFIPRRLYYQVKEGRVVENLRPLLTRETERRRVLDAGCGSGNMLARLAEMGFKELVGTDISRQSVAYAKRRLGVDVVRADVASLPFREGVFDGIACSEVIEHLKKPQTALADFGRVCANRAILVLSSPRPSLRMFLIESVWTHVRKRALEIRHVFLSEGLIAYFLAQAGFSNIAIGHAFLGCIIIATATRRPSEQKIK